MKWEKISRFSNSERTSCGRGVVRCTRMTSGMATRWKVELPNKIQSGFLTKASAKRYVERFLEGKGQ